MESVETAGEAADEYRAWEGDSVEPSLDDPFFLEHVSRYYHALQWVSPRAHVLDVACGKGYGTALLGRQAERALGIDLNEESLARARRQYGSERVEFKAWDVTRCEELGETFDVVVAFEILEHIPPGSTDAFLRGLRHVLRPGGFLLLSTPNHDVVTKSGSFVPPFHINNFKATELRELMLRYFPETRFFGQYRRRGALADAALHADVWSLRHSAVVRRLRASLRARAGSGAGGAPGGKAERRVWDFANPPPELGEMAFSERAYRQAGLSFTASRKR